MKRLSRYSLFFLFAMSFISCSHEKKHAKDLIVGKWSFYGFLFGSDSLNAEYKDYLTNADKQNEGLLISMSADGKFQSQQPKGNDMNNKSTTYQVLGDSVLVIGTDTSFIVAIDEAHFILFKNQFRPAMYFKKAD